MSRLSVALGQSASIGTDTANRLLAGIFPLHPYLLRPPCVHFSLGDDVWGQKFDHHFFGRSNHQPAMLVGIGYTNFHAYAMFVDSSSSKVYGLDPLGEDMPAALRSKITRAAQHAFPPAGPQPEPGGPGQGWQFVNSPHIRLQEEDSKACLLLCMAMITSFLEHPHHCPNTVLTRLAHQTAAAGHITAQMLSLLSLHL